MFFFAKNLLKIKKINFFIFNKNSFFFYENLKKKYTEKKYLSFK